MKKMLVFNILFLMMFFCLPVNADDTNTDREPIDFNMQLKNIQDEQSNSIDYEDIQKAIDNSIDKNTSIDFKEIVGKILSGEYDLEGKSILRMLLNTFFNDLYANIGVIVRIIIISIAGAFFKVLTESFENKQVSEMGFFVIFLLITASVIQSYSLINDIAIILIENIIVFIEALVPSLLTVTVLSGATISSAMYGESIIMLVGIINNFIKSFMLPFLYVLIVFIVLNTLSDENNLTKIIALLKKGYEWTMKIMMWVFIAIFGLKSFGLPVVDGVITRTAKQTIGIVPVVGTTLQEISDIVMGCGTVIKNAFGLGTIIAIIVIALTPVIKIAVIALAYKVSAAFIEPISENRLVDCLSGIGDVCFLLLGTILLVVLLFIVVIAMTLFITNTLLYIR